MTAGRKINGDSQDWCTPKKYVDLIKQFFGGRIGLDPCSNRYSIVGAETEFAIPRNNGLIEEWDYKTIYVNPPYGRSKGSRTSIKHWLSKCADANHRYKSEVLALVPVAPNTEHWKKFVFGAAAAICFLSDTRLKFLVKGKEGGKGAPMACAMVYWGKDVAKFTSVFSESGAVLPIPKSTKKTAQLLYKSQCDLLAQ